MENMVSVESIVEDIFQCGKCKLAFTSLTMFLDHKRDPCAPLSLTAVASVDYADDDQAVFTRHTAEPVQVPQFNQESYERSLYVPRPAAESCAPVESDKEPLRVVCIQCRKTFKTMKNLSVHLKIHTREKIFQCPVCGRCFVQNTHLQRHLGSHRVWPDGLSRTVPTATHPPAPFSTYACTFCSLLLPDYSKFRIHLKSHISEKVYMCIQSGCSERFQDLNLLLSHVQEAHTDPTYYCHLCSYSNSSLERLSNHQQNHSKTVDNPKVKQKFDCPCCDASFKTMEKLAFHKITHDHVRTCAHCNISFSSEKRLRSHLRTHEESRPFYCNSCGANFRLKRYLDTHLLSHGERKYSCPLCSSKFKREDVLGRHMKNHMNHKKWHCPFKEQLGCSMQFSRTDKLKLHLKSHAKRLVSASSTARKNPQKASTSAIEIIIIPVENGKS